MYEWRPNEKQAIALSLRKVKELFYGGARGGGKTAFLLADFLAGANEWNEHWNGIFFRQSYSQLEDVVRQAKIMYFPLGGEYHKAENYFSFPNGATIKFRYLESDTDCESYQGHEYTWIGFDELGNYRTDYAWSMMMMCLRSSTVTGDWIRIRGTGNPGGVGHKWLKARFIDGKEACKVYADIVGKDVEGRDIIVTRVFVPATVYDNKVLLNSDPTYIARLMAQPERMRQAMLEGRWDIKGGGEFFDKFDETKHVIRPSVLKGEWKRFYGFDWGKKKPWAVVKAAVGKDGQVVVYGEMYGQGVVDGVEKENVGDQRRASEIAALCARDMAAEGVTEMVADYSIWDDGSDGTNTVDFFLNAGIDMIKCVKHTANGRKSWSRILELLGERDELGQPYLRIFSTCKYLIREIETIQCDKNDPEKVDTKQADHALDALLYALTSELYEGNSKNYEPLISGGAKTGYMFNPLESGYWKNRRAF